MLYRVRYQIDTMVVASDRAGAIREALWHFGEEDTPPATMATAVRVRSGRGLADGWDDRCIPWGETRDRTIKRIMDDGDA